MTTGCGTLGAQWRRDRKSRCRSGRGSTVHRTNSTTRTTKQLIYYSRLITYKDGKAGQGTAVAYSRGPVFMVYGLWFIQPPTIASSALSTACDSRHHSRHRYRSRRDCHRNNTECAKLHAAPLAAHATHAALQAASLAAAFPTCAHVAQSKSEMRPPQPARKISMPYTWSCCEVLVLFKTYSRIS